MDGNGELSGGAEVYKRKIKVTHDGNCSWYNPVIFKSLCKIDVSYFPFDDQQCKLKFGSWAYDQSGIDIKAPSANAKQNRFYVENGEWQLMGITAKRNAEYYQCCKIPYVDLTVTIRTRRQAINYSLTLILPCTLLSFLMFLGFLLPPESGERVGLSITILLSMTVFQQLTSQIMPAYDFPYLAQYYLATILETGLSLIMTTLILNVYHRNGREMPPALRRVVFGCLVPVLFCGKSSAVAETEDEEEVKIDEVKTDDKAQIIPEYKKQIVTEHVVSKNGLSNGKRTFLKIHKPSEKRNKKSNTKVNSALGLSLQSTAFSVLGEETAKQAKDAYDKERQKAIEKERREKDWLKVARVLDRLFLLIFIVLALATLFVIFFRAPRFYS